MVDLLLEKRVFFLPLLRKVGELGKIKTCLHQRKIKIAAPLMNLLLARLGCSLGLFLILFVFITLHHRFTQASAVDGLKVEARPKPQR